MKRLSLLSLLLCLPLFGSAQNEVKSKNDEMEFGLHLNDFNGFGVIYKDQSGANSFWRYRIAALQVSASASSPANNFTFNLAFSAGYEKRKSINDKLSMLYGPELQFGLGGSNNSTNLFLGAGYVFGLQYQLPSDFLIGLEIIPLLRYNYAGSNNNGFQDNVSLNANAQSAYLFLVHQF